MEKRIIGLDIGYGFTKITDGENTAIFPSVAGDVVQADFDNDLVTAGAGHVIETGRRRFFYGEHAQKHSRNPLALFARERTEQADVLLVLFYAALAELGHQGKMALCTGLPVDWFGDRDNLERALIGEHRFTVDGEPWHVKVCQIAIVPQPFGAFFDQALDDAGNVLNAAFVRGKVGILDVGTFTTDLALSDGLEYIAKGSGSRTVAMSTVWRQVRDGIKERYGIEYDLHQIDHIVRNGRAVTVQGHDHDVGDLVAAAVENLADQVIALARDRWGRALDFKRLIVTGGGAYYLANQVQAVYPHAVATHTPDLGNLRGFRKYAARKFAR
ncbi:hypothetical protein GF406_01775 [candidate division KSB1 bacterium]|nr:hypothetical protein [candidate division KSB1 bacterium]